MWSHSSASAAPFTGALSPHFAGGSDGSGRGFREIIDALPVAVYTTDVNGKLTHFNPVCVEFAGRTPALGSDHWCVSWKLYHPDGRPMPHDECPMALALKTGKITRGAEIIAERPDGTRIWFTPYPTPLFDDAGNIIGGVNMLMDITERKQAELARHRSEEQLAAELADTQLLQGISAELIHEDNVDALYAKIMDAAVAIMRSDFASMQMLYPERGAPGSGGELRLLAQHGFSVEAAKFWEWVRADSGCTCGQVLRTGKRAIAADARTCDFMAGTPDQAAYLKGGLLAAQSTPLISRNGALVGMISTHWKQPHEPSARDLRLLDVLARQAADLIERVRYQDALRASEERFRALADAVPVLVWVSDVTKACTWFNKRWRDFSGRPMEELVGDGWTKDVHPDDLDRCMKVYTTHFDTRQMFSMEYRLKRHDGEYRWVLDEGTPLFEAGGVFAGYIGAGMDLTDRYQAEQRADNANRAKDKFLAVLSHELRTPLTPVLMTAAALDQRDDLSPDLRRDVAMVRRNVELQSRLIDDLLDLSRITSGKLRLTFDVLSVNELVGHACETCRSNLNERGIALYESLAPEVFDIVGDGGRVQQIVWNLLNNATKFTLEGGRVHVTTANVGSPDNPRVRITVRDTGIGIAPEDLARIFDAFEQAAQDGRDDIAITRKFGGMGLGLAICRALVEQHRGTISVHSDGKGKGSTFAVEFPAMARATDAGSDSGSSAPQKIGSMRLLLVEDHPDTAKVLARLLKRAGHSVQIAHDGANALTLAEKETFDLIISDLGLPDMTGHELMQRIRQRRPLKGIAMSGYGMEDDIKKSQQAGFADHVTKPATIEQLEQSIRRVMTASAPA